MRASLRAQMAIEAELAHQKILKRACRIWVQQRLSRIGVRRHRAEPHVPQKSNTPLLPFRSATLWAAQPAQAGAPANWQARTTTEPMLIGSQPRDRPLNSPLGFLPIFPTAAAGID
jgi:hypothetical protein